MRRILTLSLLALAVPGAALAAVPAKTGAALLPGSTYINQSSGPGLSCLQSAKSSGNFTFTVYVDGSAASIAQGNLSFRVDLAYKASSSSLSYSGHSQVQLHLAPSGADQPVPVSLQLLGSDGSSAMVVNSDALTYQAGGSLVWGSGTASSWTCGSSSPPPVSSGSTGGVSASSAGDTGGTGCAGIDALKAKVTQVDDLTHKLAEASKSCAAGEYKEARGQLEEFAKKLDGGDSARKYGAANASAWAACARRIELSLPLADRH